MKIKRLGVGGYIAVGVAALLTAGVLFLTLVDWNHFKRPVEHFASAKLGRQVTIAGPLQVKIWSRTPTISVSGLQIANPPWEKNDHLVRIGRLLIQLDLAAIFHGHIILRRLELTHPELYLHQEKSGRDNWTFANASKDDRAPPPLKLPAIQNAIVTDGELTLVDELRRLNVSGTIDAHESPASSDVKPFHSAGHGSINSEPFRFELSGGALLAINPDHPYPFTLNIQAGQHDIKVEGAVLHPFDLSGLDLQVAARGRDLAELYYLTQLALPNSPPYQVEAHIARSGQRFEVRDIKGTLGTSDIGGTVDVDASHKRPAIVAKLTSRHLYLKDLGALTGSRVGAEASLDAKGTNASAKSSAPIAATDASRLFPDAHLQVNRVQGMDADVTFSANTITAGALPFTHASIVATLKDGVLNVHPARLDMPQGRLSAIATIDTRQLPPAVHLDMRITDVDLAQVKGKAPTATAPLDGIFQARANIEGRGDSVRSVMANANGTVTGVIPHGEVRSAFAELTGVDVAEGVGLLFKKPDDRAAIRCGLVQFDIADGAAHADRLVMDTQNVLITGGGQVTLGSEELHLAIQGHPKKVRLVRLRTPIQIKGHVLKPKFELEAGHLVKQGAIAAALGTLLTPLAAILAFVDPGLAKNQDCAQLNTAQDTKSVLSSDSSPASSQDATKRVADAAHPP